MDIKSFIRSKKFKVALSVVGIAIVALLIFQAGMFAGYRKAAFSYRWGEQYYRTFGGPREMPLMPFPQGGFPNAHGASGKILQLSLPTFVIKEQNGIEKVISIMGDTTIQRFREAVSSTDLKVDDAVVVIGAPNEQSQIEAKLIRILPSDEMERSKTPRPR